MQTLIFSDTHLSSRVYSKKLDYLISIIEPADRVIIAGDFWDGFLTDFDGFLKSGWSVLFPLLKQRQAVYLYGNHDRNQWCDQRVNLFSTKQGLDYQMQIGSEIAYISHGHAIFTSLEDKYPAFNHSIPLRLGSSIDVVHKLVWGPRFMSGNKTINQPVRDWADQNANGRIIITGHSHYPEMDLHHHFINTGFIGCGYGNYVKVEDQRIELVKERYWRRRFDA